MGGLFDSFFIGGFECASHRRGDGVRLDLLHATGHDRWAQKDFVALAECGMRTVRDGLRWHLIEARPDCYDWSSFLPMLRAARHQGTQVIWDLCHYGYPDHLDVWRPQFVEHFARFAAAGLRSSKTKGRPHLSIRRSMRFRSGVGPGATWLISTPLASSAAWSSSINWSGPVLRQ